MSNKVLRCAECRLQFHYGDTLYFKPVPYLLGMDDEDIEIAPYCKEFIKAFALESI